MADPVMKIQFDQLKATYKELLNRLSSLQQELFQIGIEIEATKMQLSAGKPKTFNDEVQSAYRTMKPSSPFAPIKMRNMSMTAIVPHPVDKASVVDTNDWGND